MTFTTIEPAFQFRAAPGPAHFLFRMPASSCRPALTARLLERGARHSGHRLALGAPYGVAEKLGDSVLVATHSRYVIDLNRRRTDPSISGS